MGTSRVWVELEEEEDPKSVKGGDAAGLESMADEALEVDVELTCHAARVSNLETNRRVKK